MLAIFREHGLGARLHRAASAYADDYVYDDGQSAADYVPTEKERALLHDMLAGLFSDDGFSSILQEAARGMKAGGMDPEGPDTTPSA